MNTSSPGLATRSPRVKTIGNITFEDPYAGLQEDSPEALAWQWAQDAHAESVARSWPDFDRLRARIAAVNSGSNAWVSLPRRLGGTWFWAAPSPSGSARTVWTADSLDQPGRPLIEMAALVTAEEAASAMVYWFEPSPNGEFVAMAVCANGAMVGTWHIIETASGRPLPVTVPAIAYTGAVPGWLPDGSGFYHNERDPSGRHRFVFVPVKAGTPAREPVTFEFADVPANVSGLTPEVSPDGRWVIGLAGPHERIAYVIGDTRSGEWRRFLPPGYEGECGGAWLDGHTYLARAHSDDVPRGRIVAIPVATSRDAATWRELEPAGERVLRAIGVYEGRIAVAEVLHCSARFRTLDLEGKDERIVPLEGPGNSMIAFIMRRFDRSEVLTLDYQTFTRPTSIYRYDVAADRMTPIKKPGQDLPGIAVTQRFARSLDGTRVPYFLVHQTDLTFDQPRPALLTGYGGFNAALMPTFLAHLTPFIEAGGVLVHANLRGGAEYGKHWHEAGRLACKWNVFLDLFAVAEQVIADGITRPDRFAMSGASNGGLLAGVAIVHRPELWRVVVPVVPLFDQMEPLVGGPEMDPVRSIFHEDYGDPANPAMAKVLYSYSPYHNIREGVAYPAVFQVFGEKDLGCQPFQGRKFTARLQEANTSPHPILLRVWRNTGHGAMGDTGQLQAAEWVGFVMRELGMRVAG